MSCLKCAIFRGLPGGFLRMSGCLSCITVDGYSSPGPYYYRVSESVVNTRKQICGGIQFACRSPISRTAGDASLRRIGVWRGVPRICHERFIERNILPWNRDNRVIHGDPSSLLVIPSRINQQQKKLTPPPHHTNTKTILNSQHHYTHIQYFAS